MRFTCSLLFCLCYVIGYSQNQKTGYSEIKGMLVDSLTALPISSAHIRTSSFKTVSNADGSFSIFVLLNDSVHFSHVGYHDLVISSDQLSHPTPITVAMIQKVTLLGTVNVYALTEAKFRKEVLETTPVESQEEQNAKTNMAVLNYYIKSLPQLKMTEAENYREYMKGPQGVTIISSNGQGLIKAVRDVIKFRPVPYKAFPRRGETVPNFKLNILYDSIRTNKSNLDSLNVSHKKE